MIKIEETYDCEKWSYEQYIDKRKSITDIAKEQGVTRGVIGGRVRKFGIKKPKHLIQTRIPAKYSELICSHCSESFMKKDTDIAWSKARGLKEFYCDQTCFGLAHSESMSGEGNPNFGNVNKITPNDYRTKEQMSQHAKDAWARHRLNGVYEERLKKMWEGSNRFFATEEGKALRRMQGYLSMRTQRHKESSIEKKMREELAERCVEFEQEKTFQKRYRIDFYIPKYELAIECDGDYWHNLPEVIKKDKTRDLFFIGEGVKVMRFWEHEINKDVSACVDLIMAYINEAEAV